jgi:hypothetical protein
MLTIFNATRGCDRALTSSSDGQGECWGRRITTWSLLAVQPSPKFRLCNLFRPGSVCQDSSPLQILNWQNSIHSFWLEMR